MSQQIPAYEAPSKSELPPSILAHIVLRTADLKEMSEFYVKVLGGRVTYSNEMVSFITYDHMLHDEHHRVALIGIPDTATKAPETCGREHIAFGLASLSNFLLSYRQRKRNGINAVWCVNHDPTTSFYYMDLDGNMLETHVDNFGTVEEATAFITSDKFSENPIGTDFDTEELI